MCHIIKTSRLVFSYNLMSVLSNYLNNNSQNVMTDILNDHFNK